MHAFMLGAPPWKSELVQVKGLILRKRNLNHHLQELLSSSCKIVKPLQRRLLAFFICLGSMDKHSTDIDIHRAPRRKDEPCKSFSCSAWIKKNIMGASDYGDIDIFHTVHSRMYLLLDGPLCTLQLFSAAQNEHFPCYLNTKLVPIV